MTAYYPPESELPMYGAIRPTTTKGETMNIISRNARFEDEDKAVQKDIEREARKQGEMRDAIRSYLTEFISNDDEVDDMTDLFVDRIITATFGGGVK